jgi:dTDP-4-dehydrorhamnose reductase
MTTLIVGGTGLIGSGMSEIYSNVKSLVVTSRSVKCSINFNFDLKDNDLSGLLKHNFEDAYICAGASGFEYCQKFPSDTYEINVKNTLALIEALVSKGAFVIWLSSSSVFDGSSECVEEISPCNPSTIYGRQKLEVEQAVRNHPQMAARVAIVRLTKVIGHKNGFVEKIVHQLITKNRVDAFRDVYLSPVSLIYVCRALRAISMKRVPGVYHLSGECGLSYLQFAQMVAIRLGLPKDLIRSVHSSESVGDKLLYKPLHPALLMKRTNDIIGLRPEPVSSILDYVCSGLAL